jgi:hypothetical protein
MIREALPREAERTARHREKDLLTRFLLGEAEPRENRAVVRHLLAGCGLCLQVTRRFWLLGEKP